MECYLSRISTLFSTYTALLALATVFNYTSHFLFLQRPTGKVHIQSLVDFKYIPVLKGEHAYFRFNVKGDLTSAFQWNTNQIFVYVMIRYKTDDFKVNEVIIWDSIITKRQRAKFNYKNIFSKYPLESIGRQLRGTTVESVLVYRYMPIVGFMKEYTVASSSFVFPQSYLYATHNN